MHNLLAYKGKRNVWKTYLMMFTMFLFLLSPALSLQSYDTVFAEDGTKTGEENEAGTVDEGAGSTEADKDDGSVRAEESQEPGDDENPEDGGDDPVDNEEDLNEGEEPVDDGVAPEENEQEVDELTKVSPEDPIVQQAMCEEDRDTVTDPELYLQETNGVQYDVNGEVEIGNTVTIIASPADDTVEIEAAGDWVKQADGTATMQVEFIEPDCGEETEEPVVVTPLLPKVTEAICDENGEVTKPEVDINHHGYPVDVGVIYEFAGDVDPDNLQPGDTVTIIAGAYDRFEGEGLVLEIPEGWQDVGDGLAIYEFDLDDPDCNVPVEGEDPTDEDDPADKDDSVTGEIIKIDRDGCIVSITTSLDEGDYTIEVWDDGQKIDEVKGTVTEAGEHVFTWEITQPAMEDAPGVGFVLYDENGMQLDQVDPYEYPAEVADKCAGVTPDDSDEGESQTEDESPVFTGEIIKIDRDGCIVSITTSLDEGDYTIEVWDDGQKIDEVKDTVTEAGEHVFTWEITQPAMEAAPGVAFSLLDENDGQLDFVDPYEYPAEVADKCAGVTADGKGGPVATADVIGKGGPADEVDTEEPVDGDLLPATATPLFNFIFAGAILLLFGGITLIVIRKRKKALE